MRCDTIFCSFVVLAVFAQGSEAAPKHDGPLNKHWLLKKLFRRQSAQCVSSCTGLPDGDYESCIGCNVYASCGGGVLYDNRSCPANLVWDDNLKNCEYTSSTCCSAAPATGVCVSDCECVPPGDYQSCQGCDVYASCNGILYDNRPCPQGLVWDDSNKRCESTSTTCQSTAQNCISSCVGESDGDYQSCNGCEVYASCSGGTLFDNRPCPGGLVWDDGSKRCEFTSTTCSTPP